LVFAVGELRLDLLHRLALLDDFLAIAAQEVVDRLDANPD
jgi:hypothetical protein